jgi:hypothetical protein
MPGGPVDFVVADIQRPQHLVIALLGQRLLGHRIDFTLAFRLRAQEIPRRPSGPDTRLVSRARARIEGPAGGLLTKALTVGDGIMVRRQLLGLAERCGQPTSAEVRE